MNNVENKKIAVLIATVAVLFNPSVVKVESRSKEKVLKVNENKRNFLNIWALSSRNFIMDKRWQLQYRLSK